MRKFGHTLLFPLGIIALIVIFQLPLLAQGNTIEVKCMDSSNNPVAGVNVRISLIKIPPEAPKIKEKKSDNSGIALFNKVDNGIYRIVGRKNSFAPALYEFVRMNGAQQTVALRMESGDSNKKLYCEDMMVAQQANTLGKVGTDAYSAQKYTDAEKAYREAIDLNPSDAFIIFNLGYILIQKGDMAGAEEMTKRASALADIWCELLKGKPGAEQYASLKQGAESRLNALPLVKLLGEGQKALDAKNFDAAIAKFNEAIKVNASVPDVYYNLAVAQTQAKKYQDALASITKAVELNPNDKEMVDLKAKIFLFRAQDFLNEGAVQRKANNFEGALKNFEGALPLVTEAKPKAVVYASIGRTQTDLARYDQAVESFRKAIELDPDKVDYRNLLANCYLKQKKYDEMFNVLADPKAAGGRPVDAQLLDLGKKFFNQGGDDNSQIARLAFERALKINPDNAEAIYELGTLLYIDKSDDKRALELLEQYGKVGKNQANLSNAGGSIIMIKRRLPK